MPPQPKSLPMSVSLKASTGLIRETVRLAGTYRQRFN